MNAVLEKISAIGIVPVIKIDNVANAVPLAKALVEGGLPCAEVTFRTAEAEEAIKLISEAVPDMLVGAGTVLTIDQVDRAVAAGAKFIVSPGLNPKIVKYCIDKGIPVAPGTSNASDIEQALELGLDVVKFFPAEQSGGIKAIKALAAPYTKVKFMPTGGINANNLNDYLSFNKILACGGSWMVNADLINAGEFDKIKEMTEEAVKTMLGFQIAHVGINAECAEQAEAIAKLFEAVFGFKAKNGNSSLFAGTAVEVMKNGGKGKFGHIAIQTNYLTRAIHYLESKGYEFDEEGREKALAGKAGACYLKADFGGFAVHLLQKK